MKYFRHLFDSTADALVTIFFEGRHADKVVDHYFRNNKKWGKRDRQFFADTVYGCVRWWRKYEYLSESVGEEPLDQANKAIAVHLIASGNPLPAWYEGLVDSNVVRERNQKVSEPAVRESYPDWLYEHVGQEMGGDVWKKIANELNKPAPAVLRVNTIKTTSEKLTKVLRDEGFQLQPMDTETVPEGLMLTQRANVFGTEAYRNGAFEVQDGSSQMVGRFLAPKPGERVVDACAGAGGKSLHLAALMQNKGKIIALDVVAWKIEELKKRARRAGVSIIEPKVIDSTKVIKRLHNTADALLLDVPCTGLGVLKRHPDTKWKLTPEKLAELEVLQKEILQSYSAIVKVGGRMVYSTCSILPSENQKQVQGFLANNPGWSQVSEKIILPNEEGFDGFYMALLKKNN